VIVPGHLDQAGGFAGSSLVCMVCSKFGQDRPPSLQRDPKTDPERQAARRRAQARRPPHPQAAPVVRLAKKIKPRAGNRLSAVSVLAKTQATRT
jgi:hypothetical protein